MDADTPTKTKFDPNAWLRYWTGLPPGVIYTAVALVAVWAIVATRRKGA